MKPAAKPDNEQERLGLLKKLDILDTLEEQAYDDLTKIASHICGCPIALVSLLDDERQWFKSHHGLDATETPREYAFCGHAILGDNIFYVPDSEKDERFFDNPLVVGAPNVKFYAGIPLKLRGEYNVGTLCVIDNKPRELSEEQLDALRSLGRQVVSQLELRLKIKELEIIDRMKSEFMAMVSHELRTPLTSIFGSLSILNSGLMAGQKDKVDLLVKASYDNSERLIKIVNDILDLTKIESGTFKIELKEVELNDIVKTATENLSAYFEKCKVEVKLNLDASIGKVFLDDCRIVQVINNLASNAAKFSPENTTVEITTKDEGEYYGIQIKDHGPGIPEVLHSEIFEKFSKASVVGKGKLPGTGLGLNIARQLVELHGGKIWFESGAGKGTTFFVRLPKNPSA